MSTVFIYDNSVGVSSQKFSETLADEVFQITARKAAEESLMIFHEIFSQSFGKTNACVKLSQISGGHLINSY